MNDVVGFVRGSCRGVYLGRINEALGTNFDCNASNFFTQALNFNRAVRVRRIREAPPSDYNENEWQVYTVRGVDKREKFNVYFNPDRLLPPEKIGWEWMRVYSQRGICGELDIFGREFYE